MQITGGTHTSKSHPVGVRQTNGSRPAVNDPRKFGLQDDPGSAIVTGLAALSEAARNA